MIFKLLQSVSLERFRSFPHVELSLPRGARNRHGPSSAANLAQNATVRVWLYEQLSIRIEGRIRVRGSPVSRYRGPKLTTIQGFDEFMNLVIDDAVEVKQPPRGAAKDEAEEPRKPLGTSPRQSSACAKTLTISPQARSCSRATTYP